MSRQRSADPMTIAPEAADRAIPTRHRPLTELSVCYTKDCPSTVDPCPSPTCSCSRPTSLNDDEPNLPGCAAGAASPRLAQGTRPVVKPLRPVAPDIIPPSGLTPGHPALARAHRAQRLHPRPPPFGPVCGRGMNEWSLDCERHAHLTAHSRRRRIHALGRSRAEFRLDVKPKRGPMGLRRSAQVVLVPSASVSASALAYAALSIDALRAHESAAHRPVTIGPSG